MKEKMTALGAEAMFGSPEQFAGYVRDEVAKWKKVIVAAGLKPE